jgi:hypothetical protein
MTHTISDTREDQFMDLVKAVGSSSHKRNLEKDKRIQHCKGEFEEFLKSKTGEPLLLSIDYQKIGRTRSIEIGYLNGEQISVSDQVCPKIIFPTKGNVIHSESRYFNHYATYLDKDNVFFVNCSSFNDNGKTIIFPSVDHLVIPRIDDKERPLGYTLDLKIGFQEVEDFVRKYDDGHYIPDYLLAAYRLGKKPASSDLIVTLFAREFESLIEKSYYKEGSERVCKYLVDRGLHKRPELIYESIIPEELRRQTAEFGIDLPEKSPIKIAEHLIRKCKKYGINPENPRSG